MFASCSVTVYNEMIEDGMRLVYKNIGDKMHVLGTPEDLEAFMELELAKTIFGVE